MKHDPVTGGRYIPQAGSVAPAENLDANPSSLDRAYTAQMECDGMTSTYIIFAKWNGENDTVQLIEAYELGRPFVSNQALTRVEDLVVRYLLATMVADEATKPVRSSDANS